MHTLILSLSSFRLRKNFPIIDLGEFLRQIQVIPADDAILDEPFAGFGHLLVLFLRLQEFAWIADRDRAREGVDMLDAAEHFSMDMRNTGSSITRKMKMLFRCRGLMLKD